MTETATTILIDLGQGERGKQRKRALLDLAEQNDHKWGGNPSIGRLIVALADAEIERQKGETDMYYTIDSDKLEQIVSLFNAQVDPEVTDDIIECEICADWHEGDEHQEWINTAQPSEIVDWLASFYE